eukprot:scaffold64764_cov66-Phaeocystis_antarctica.AAC.8
MMPGFATLAAVSRFRLRRTPSRRPLPSRRHSVRTRPSTCRRESGHEWMLTVHLHVEGLIDCLDSDEVHDSHGHLDRTTPLHALLLEGVGGGPCTARRRLPRLHSLESADRRRYAAALHRAHDV